MKKIIIFVIIFTIVIVVKDLNNNIVIPKESIRFRIIANSNSDKDQILKQKVKTNIEPELISIMKNSNSLEQTRKDIKNNLSSFKENVEEVLLKDNSNQKVTINYGDNYFPRKEYENTYYDEGKYESLVITLGEGKGDNFWCVLFPPLCLLDTEEQKTKKAEYHFLIKDIIDKYTK